MERHWFSHSKTSVPNKLCLPCLCSLRCTCSFSRPSTADVLSLRPYAHTTNNLGSRSPSIAPMFSCQGSRPQPDHRGNTLVRTSTGVSLPLGFKICALSELFSSLTDYPGGGGLPGVTPCPFGQLYITTSKSICQHFFCNFPYFFSVGIAGYSRLYRDNKYPLFRILMGLQALFILT